MLENNQVIIATTIFLVTYAIIVSEKIHRTVAALSARRLLSSWGLFLPKKQSLPDFNTIGLLVGMMIIVGVTRQTGVLNTSP